MGACLSGLTGHQLIIDLLLQDLRGHDNDLNNITLRARVLNDEQAARHLEESATAELALGNPFAWRNVLKATPACWSATQWPRAAQLDVGVGVVGSILDGWNAVMAARQVDEQGWKQALWSGGWARFLLGHALFLCIRPHSLLVAAGKTNLHKSGLP